MTAWGFHAAHEMHAPSALLAAAVAAEQAGFDAISCSDHFHPWVPSQGHSGYSWAWLGAVMERTRLPAGSIVSPGQRQHPALVAQAIATLAEMSPGRAWFALGTGEALNESITGDGWPPMPERRERLLACVDVIRRLLAGETVTRDEAGVRVRRARLSTLPRQPVPLLGAALSAEGAAWCADWADGLVTARGTSSEMAEILRAYRRQGGRGPVVLQALHAWARTDEEARALAARQWPVAALESSQVVDLPTPEEMHAAVRDKSPDEIVTRIPCSADPAEHRRWCEEYADLGFDAVYVLPLGAPPPDFIAFYSREVLPRLR